MIINIETIEQFNELKKKGVVLIDFWAPWCVYCRRIAPAYEKIAEQFGESLVVAKRVAKAIRIKAEKGLVDPAEFPMLLSAVAIGNVAMFGIPGEPFTGVGRGLKEAENWDLVLPCALTNDSVGYFPMQEAYDEGGYEARSSNFKAGIAELIIDEGKQMLLQLH